MAGSSSREAGPSLAPVPLLTSSDALPSTPSRVVVAGTSGSGKTTLAARIGALLDLPHVEIDALHHGPGWTKRPSFEDDVRALADGPAWVTEWQYSSVRPLLADRADLFVWLALPRRTVMRRVVARTLRRRFRRIELWNGNLEPPLWTFLTDPEHIVRWAWRTHGTYPGRVAAVAQRRPELPVVRLHHSREVEAWLAGPLATAPGHRHP